MGNKQSPRSIRIGDNIQKLLAPYLSREYRPPGGGLVTLTAVTVSSELSHARIYVTTIGNDLDKESVIDDLNLCKGAFRSHLAKNMRTRKLPNLRFVYDYSIEKGVHLQGLIESTRDKTPHEES